MSMGTLTIKGDLLETNFQCFNQKKALVAISASYFLKNHWWLLVFIPPWSIYLYNCGCLCMCLSLVRENLCLLIYIRKIQNWSYLLIKVKSVPEYWSKKVFIWQYLSFETKISFLVGGWWWVKSDFSVSLCPFLFL